MPTEKPFGVVRDANNEAKRHENDGKAPEFDMARITFIRGKLAKCGIRALTRLECKELDRYERAHPKPLPGLNLGALLRRAGV